MKYFKFEIPLNEDGTRASYSPGWYGYTSVSFVEVEVILYNDKEGYGIARYDDKGSPHKPLETVTEKKANDTIAGLKEEDGVYFGKSLSERKEWLPETTMVEAEVK